MRGRRKRLKTASADGRKPRYSIGPESASNHLPVSSFLDQQYDSQFSVDCSMFECGSFASRSSIRLVHEVVSKFDLQKREVVKSIGFEGILHFPPIKQYNRKFALWLMSCVNAEFSSLVIGQHMSISFTKGDVGHVFGIPSSGKSVLDLTVCSREAKDRVLQKFLGAEFKDHRSIKLVQEVVEREYSVPMTKSEADTFRVAFVVFVVSNLLCPSAKYDYASIDYWNAIQEPDAIITYDWAEYVIVRLLEAVSKLKQDVSSNIKFPNISGCSIFLQVLYLDSLDIPGLAMPHNNFPRIRDFSYEKLRSMILADKNYAKHKSSDVALPAGKLRPKSECIYSWAKDQGSDNDEPRSEWLFAIWESAVAMVHLLNIPLEAAGPVFVAAADFQQQINSGLSITGTQAIKFMSVLVSIMIPYTRGFSYQPSYSLDPALSGFDALESAITNGITLMSSPIRHTGKANSDTMHGQCSISKPSNMKHMLSTRSNTSEASTSTQGWATLDHTFIGDHVQRSFNSAISSLDDTPHNLNVNLRVATAMSQFYSLLRRLKPARGFDLNTCVPHEDTSLQSPTLILHSASGVLPNPWHLGYAWSNDGVKTTRAYDKLNSIEDDDRLAIIHRNPKYIQVSSLALRDQFTGKREFELDLFDALIRVVRQQDDLMYAPFGNLRWRIFFESDFMEAILSRASDLLHRSLCEHLSLADCTYDLSKTKLMFFPALLQCRWVCFVWSIENNVISVFEPSHGAPVPESRVEAIERSCFLLKLAMHTLSRSVFHGLSHEAMCADMRLLTLSDISAPLCFNRSGALCSFFCRCYDGGDLTPRPSELDADTIAAKLLNEIVDLKDNSRTIPPQLKAESLSASPAR